MQENERLNVLVIEDDADTRANLADILELDGHELQLAGSLADARRNSDWASASIILLDRKLPDGDAETALPELRHLAPMAEIVIITGYRDLEGALACLHQGAADYVLKPINADLLRANLSRLAKSRRSAQQLRLLATAVRDVTEGILITDGSLDLPGPRILFANEAMYSITGYTQEELLGATPRILQSSRTDAELWEEMKHQLRQGKSFTAEVLNRRKDGTVYYADLHVSPVFDASGRVTNYVSTQRDITARKRAEERMLQAERLAAIGQVVTGLAHESRNALQRSLTCLESLAIELQDRPESLDLVRRALEAQRHLHHLYEEVRHYAAPINLHRAPVRIRDVWREAWSELEIHRAKRVATLHEEAADSLPAFFLDAFALRQVFRNVFENSLAACADPCRITVRAETKLHEKHEWLQVAVFDNGPGLTAEQAQRIFEPFFSTKTRGTGLGMAISQRIVEAHGGQMEAGNADQGGALILISLPATEGTPRT